MGSEDFIQETIAVVSAEAKREALENIRQLVENARTAAACWEEVHGDKSRKVLALIRNCNLAAAAALTHLITHEERQELSARLGVDYNFTRFRI